MNTSLLATIHVLDTLGRVLSRLLLIIGGVMLTAMMILACSNMFMRGAMGAPIQGTYELMGFLGAIVSAFALAATQMRKGHIALTMLAGKFPPIVDRYIDAFTNLACAAFFGLIAWKTSAYGSSLIEYGELSQDMTIPFHGFVYAVAFGSGVLALNLFTDSLKSLADWKES
ncbi:MAG: TRAP transporter small permease [Proteobacteria bacterium]|nr:TRAP transporter small permease [Pseudomonadota bacterium]